MKNTREVFIPSITNGKGTGFCIKKGLGSMPASAISSQCKCG